ncbi:thrombospondin type-1 domain-containing protein 4 [Lepisosteus oculatus]|uniref:thrombospondin type-1 domain-containing protein 4 n=1 Tax=Lepisosteus oculatus TaxID=7918 RepID=UPI00371754C1
MRETRGRGGCRLCLLSVVLSLLFAGVQLSQPEPEAPGRASRQAPASEGPVGPLQGVWGPWGAWTPCSRSCGFGISERRRQCLLPVADPSQTWGPFPLHPAAPPSLREQGGVISALRPNYAPLRELRKPPSDPSLYVGPPDSSRQPHHLHSPHSANQEPGLSLYSTGPDPVHQPPLTYQEPQFHQPDFSPANQEMVSLYRQPFSSSSNGYSQSGRTAHRPANQGRGRGGGGGGGGNRRSVPTSQDAGSSRRSFSSSVLPGQFGYGRVPFSLPLLRPARRARHSAHMAGGNSTRAPETAPQEGAEHTGQDGAAVTARTPGGREGQGQGAERGGDRGEQQHPQPDRRTAGGATGLPRGPGPLPDRGPEAGGGLQREPPDGGVSQAGGAQIQGSWEGPGRTLTDTRSRSPPQSRNSEAGTPARAPPDWERPRSWMREHGAPPHPHPRPRLRSRPQREPPYTLNPGLSRPLPLAGPHVWPLRSQEPPPAESEGRGGPRGLPHPHTPPPSSTLPLHSCPGKERELRPCSPQPCPEGAVDPRAEQCAQYNGHNFMGRHYSWEPFMEVGAGQQCELTCRPVGLRFYVRQADRVRDGTPCHSNGTDICVDGACLSLGCDGVLDSSLRWDACGICGGDNSSCRRVSGTFANSSIPIGYHRFLEIPVGAMRINITERQSSPNYLALRSGSGQPLVNGRWAIDPPGQYEGGGTVFQYQRAAGGGGGESLTAPGPTTTVLHVYIIFHKQNPGIDFDFLLPVGRAERPTPPAHQPQPDFGALTLQAAPAARERGGAGRGALRGESPRSRGSAPHRNVRIPPRTDVPPDTQPEFVWRRGPLTECSASCGKGVQYRVYQCVFRKTQEEVPDRKCDAASRPVPQEESCNVQPCPAFWEAGEWSECSRSCGPGLQHRQLQCRQSYANRSTMVHPQRCAALSRPNATQPCQLRVCSQWEIRTNWSSCSVMCGVGKRTRNVRCVSTQGAVVSDRECNTRLRPPGSQDCDMGPCVLSWYHTDWSHSCSAGCGPGVQRRSVVCLSSGGGAADPEGGQTCTGERPAEMRACNGGPCLPALHWYTGPWGECSVACGNGTQRRDIICVQRLGNDINVTHSRDCESQEKPPSIQSCSAGPCKPQWFTTDWSACSRSCMGGVQVREVRCLTEDRNLSRDCDPSARPQEQQLCNQQPCNADLDENCQDKHHNCPLLVQARMCIYSYYKAVCCASCTRAAQRAKRH